MNANPTTKLTVTMAAITIRNPVGLSERCGVSTAVNGGGLAVDAASDMLSVICQA